MYAHSTHEKKRLNSDNGNMKINIHACAAIAVMFLSSIIRFKSKRKREFCLCKKREEERNSNLSHHSLTHSLSHQNNTFIVYNYSC
jgi:hypothetical protein